MHVAQEVTPLAQAAKSSSTTLRWFLAAALIVQGRLPTTACLTHICTFLEKQAHNLVLSTICDAVILLGGAHSEEDPHYPTLTSPAKIAWYKRAPLGPPLSFTSAQNLAALVALPEAALLCWLSEAGHGIVSCYHPTA